MIGYKRVVAIEGWARGKHGIMRLQDGYCTVLFEGQDGYLVYYDPAALIESDDEFEDFVHLTRSRELSS